ncbi:MAG: hypothetical protein NDJ90_10360, partial [Oligoflexia bacterium]|nr:hypothetical protein [Oligoflexia bacterium]
EELQGYRQASYQLVDPAGDYALLRRSQLVPERIVRYLTGVKDKTPRKVDLDHGEDYEATTPEERPAPPPLSSEEAFAGYLERNPSLASIFRPVTGGTLPQTDDDKRKMIAALENAGRPIHGRESPIRREGFVRMFAQIILEETANGIQPSYGTPHEWSEEFLAKYRETSMMLASSKVLMALAVGDTNRFMRTDREAQLYKWMIAHPDRTLTLPEVFRQSYRLNMGDMYLTLLTIENVLAHQWRNGQREKLPLTHRLRAITSGHEDSRDRFGTWYHLIGIMLYGYVEGAFKGEAIGRIESLGSFMLTPKNNQYQKRLINRDGGLVGGDLAQLIRTRAYLNHRSDPAHLEEVSYLNRAEDFRDRISVPLSGELQATLHRDIERGFVSLRDTRRELRDCVVELMPDLGRGFEAPLKDVARRVPIGADENTLTVFSPGVRAVRGFVSCEGLGETLVFEAR